jgi:hypothetical protein
MTLILFTGPPMPLSARKSELTQQQTPVSTQLTLKGIVTDRGRQRDSFLPSRARQSMLVGQVGIRAGTPR